MTSLQFDLNGRLLIEFCLAGKRPTAPIYLFNLWKQLYCKSEMPSDVEECPQKKLFGRCTQKYIGYFVRAFMIYFIVSIFAYRGWIDCTISVIGGLHV